MKLLPLSVIFILACITCFSQKQFEGTIIYNLHSQEEERKDDAELTVVFGKNALKLRFKEKDHYAKDEILILVDSGKIYTLNTENKTFTAKKIKQLESRPEQFSGKKISGYTTTAINASGNTAIGSLAGMFRMGNAIFYTADSLYYTVPEKYASNAELAFLHQGKIVLGAEIMPFNYSLGDGDEEDRNKREERMKIVIEATSVKWEIHNDNEFSIPADYVKYTYAPPADDSVLAAPDSIAVAMAVADSTVPGMPEKATPVKKPPVNKKQPAKPKTKTNAQSTPIKKPE